MVSKFVCLSFVFSCRLTSGCLTFNGAWSLADGKNNLKWFVIYLLSSYGKLKTKEGMRNEIRKLVIFL